MINSKELVVAINNVSKDLKLIEDLKRIKQILIDNDIKESLVYEAIADEIKKIQQALKELYIMVIRNFTNE